MIAFSYIRDTIVIDADLLAELKTEIATRKINPGATLLLAARSIRHTTGYALRLENFNLVVAADEYDSAGGSIDVSGVSGIPGALGKKGAAGTVSAGGQSDKPGGAGGSGGNGTTGSKGNTLQVFAKTLVSGNFASSGGAGGSGGNGGNGGDGGVGKRVTIGTEGRGGGKHQEPIGTDGGNGGNGGNGANGAAGGQINVLYLKANAAPKMQAAGGAKGKAGSAGTAGKGGPGCTDGKPGKAGVAATAEGAAGTAKAGVAASEAAFWAAVRTAIGTGPAGDWASYRLRCGDHHFRTAAKPLVGAKMAMAHADFVAAANLDTGSPGRVRRSAMMAGHNPLGLRRDMYIVPDFPRYESAYTDYAPLIQGMLSVAQQLLLQASNVGANKQRLTAERDHFQLQKAIVASEMAEADLELKNAQSAVAEIDTRISSLQASIKAKEKELEAARLELNGEVIGSIFAVIGAVASVAGACVTAGASLAALPGLLVAAEGAWSRMSKDASGNLKYDDRPLADIIKWEDKDGKFSPTVKKEIQAEIAGLVAVVKNGEKAYKATLDLIDKFKVLDDISAATVTGGPADQLRELMKQSAQIHLDRSQAQTVVEIAKIRMETVKLKDKQVDADLVAAQEMIDGMSADTKLLGRACRLIVRRAQDYMDLLLRFHFQAARALEIYTYQERTSTVDYSLGRVAPDLEESAYTRLSRGDSTGVLSLLEAYINSWGKLPAPIILRNAYENYRQGLASQSDFWVLEGASVNPLRETGSVELEVKPEALLGDPFECKLEGASVALVGAKATLPFVPVVLVHGGNSRVQLLGGKTIEQNFAPRAVALQAAKTEEAINQVPVMPAEAFWGRSPITRWRLYVQPEALPSIDLSGLTKIVIGVGFKALNPALGVRAPDAAA